MKLPLVIHYRLFGIKEPTVNVYNGILTVVEMKTSCTAVMSQCQMLSGMRRCFDVATLNPYDPSDRCDWINSIILQQQNRWYCNHVSIFFRASYLVKWLWYLHHNMVRNQYIVTKIRKLKMVISSFMSSFSII